jgi:hypothetical protein
MRAYAKRSRVIAPRNVVNQLAIRFVAALTRPSGTLSPRERGNTKYLRRSFTAIRLKTIAPQHRTLESSHCPPLAESTLFGTPHD